MMKESYHHMILSMYDFELKIIEFLLDWKVAKIWNQE